MKCRVDCECRSLFKILSCRSIYCCIKNYKSKHLHKRKLTPMFIPLVTLMKVDQFEESNNVEEKIGSFEKLAEYH